MEILCVGLSHHTAPIEIRERFAVPDSHLPAAAAELAQRHGLSEAVIVSTCNRVDFYVAAERAEHGFTAIHEFVATRAAIPEGDTFFRHVSPRAVRHLFKVVCGLDS